MAKDSIESLLQIGSVAPEGTPINTPPVFNESQFVGGDTRLGQISKRVGPSGDAAMYAGLAEIAGGVQTAINTFSDIAGREDKRKVNEVSMEMDRLNETDLTPEQKQSALDNYMKDVWTPTLGTAWRTQVANDVNKRWLSDDARDAFEEKRYRQEFKNFLNRPEILGRQQTPELAELFQKEYEGRFPTAETTAWYTLKRFETTSQLVAKVIENAQSTLAPSIDNMIQVPNQEQQNSMSLGNTDTISYFKGFNDWATRARLSRDISTFTTDVSAFLQGEIEKTFDKDTPIEVKEQIARDLPRIAFLKAKEVYDAAMKMEFNEKEQQSLAILTTAEQNFKTTPYSIDGVNHYLSAVANNLRLANVPLAAKRTAVNQVMSLIMNKITSAIDTGTDKDLQTKYPNWATMSVIERIDVAEDLMNQWADQGNNGIKLIEAMGYSQAEIESMGVKTAKQAANKLIAQNGRLMALQDPAVRQELTRDAEDRNDDISLLKDSFSSSNSSTWIAQRTDVGLSSIAKSIGISLDTLKSAVLTKTGEPVAILDASKWLLTIQDSEEVITLNRNGMTLEKNKSLNTYLNMALSLVNASQAQQVRLEGKSQETIFDATSITKSAEKYFPGAKDQGEKKSIINAFTSGELGKIGDDSKFFSVLRSYASAILSESDPEFIAAVDKELPMIRQYADAIKGGIQMQQELLSGFITNIPSVAPGGKPDYQENARKLSESFNRGISDLLAGRASFKLDSYPSTIIDETGTWSQEASFHFVQLQYLSNRAFQSDSSDADRTQFNDMVDTALTNLGSGTTNYLQTPQGKFDLVTLALVGKEYNKATQNNGVQPKISDQNFFVNRAIMLGNWAEETNLPSMLQKLNDPTNREFMDANLAIPVMLGALQSGQRQVTTYGLGGNQAFVKEYITSNKTALKTASAFSSQLSQLVVVGDGFIAAGGVPPTNQLWTSEILRAALTETLGEDVTTATLARELRMLVKTIPDDVWNSLSEDDQIRAGSIALNHKFEGNQGLLILTMDMFFGPKGISTSALQPRSNLAETKLNILMNFIDVAGDFDAVSIPTNYSNTKVGSQVMNTKPVYEGLVTNPEGFQTPKMGTVFNIQSDEPSQSFTVETSNAIINTFEKSGVFPKVKARIGEIYKPRLIEGVNKSGIGKADGPMYIAGATALSSPPPTDVRTRLSLTQNWAAAHGIQNAEATMSFLNIKGLFMNAVYQEGMNDSLAAKKALQDNVKKEFNSTSEYLQAVNDSYISYGGSNPLMNKERFSKWSSPGYAELLQSFNNLGDRMAMLPTYGFSNSSLNGTPYITVTNAYLSPIDPNNPSENSESIKVMINASKQKLLEEQKKKEQEAFGGVDRYRGGGGI